MIVLFIERVFFVFDYFRDVHDGWHDATPCRKTHRMRPGLSLAEQSARRYWRGVEGGTVLSHNSISLQKIYAMVLQKQN
jgi:hypothetical protein